MEVGMKKESPITYSNGKRLFTIDQKVDALVRIKMTGCSKAEVARSLHVAESTFRGWFKNKDIVMKAEAKYNEIKSKSSSTTSSDGYKSDDNNSDNKSFSVEDNSDNNSSTSFMEVEDREGTPSRFSSPDTSVAPTHVAPTHVAPTHVAPTHVDPIRVDPIRVDPIRVDPIRVDPIVRRSPERVHHHKKLKKQQHLNNNIGGLNNNGGLTAAAAAAAAATLTSGFNNSINALANGPANTLNGGLSGGLANGLTGGLANGLSGGLANGLSGGLANGLSGGLANGLNHLNQQQQLQHHLSQLAHHPLHHNLSSLTGLKGPNAAAAAVAAATAAAAAAAAAAATADHPSLRLSPAELQSKINNYFSPSPLLAATSLPGGSVNFLSPNFTAENCYNKSSSFINTMVTATLMEPQALDLSTHSRNKCGLNSATRNPLW